jgi:hypothetical protein
MKAFVLVLVALLAISAAAVSNNVHKLKRVEATTEEKFKAAIQGLATDKNFLAGRETIVRHLNKEIAMAQMKGELGGCLAAAKSFKIEADSFDDSDYLYGAGHYDGLVEDYKEALGEPTIITFSFSVTASAAFFIGIEGNIGLNLEHHAKHGSTNAYLLFRPCAEAGLTLGLSVGAGVGLKFALFFGDSEFGGSANFTPGCTISAGLGLGLSVLFRIGSSKEDKAAQATAEAAVIADAATTNTAQATKKTDESWLKTKAKEFGAKLVAGVKAWFKDLPNSKLVGFALTVETGYKVESKIGLKDSTGKTVGEGILAALFGKVMDKISTWCKGNATCNKLAGKFGGLDF